LNFNFIKQFWQLLKLDILCFLDEFYVHGVFSRGCNASFIALIPKVADPRFLNDYRPISLIGCMYKIVAKLLANRMKKVMALIVDETQYAFIEARHLLHSVLIANEVIEEAKRSSKSCLIFKVDYEKAYDSVSWDFLLYMLDRAGFSSIWIKWIERCLKSASISVLVNGSPTTEFFPKRGLRQGDLLAPFLFNVVAKGLNGLIRKTKEENMYKAFQVGSNKVEISILQFADDTIFFGEANMENVKIIKAILRTFELISGLKINFTWRRSLFENEIDSEVSFLRDIAVKSIQQQGPDAWVWYKDPAGQYSTCNAYMLGEEAAAGMQEECFEKLWKIRIPARIAVFAWRLIRDRLLTRQNLRRRQVQITNMLCPFCRIEEEGASHLFFHCSKIQPIWWDTMSWLHIKGAFPLSPKQHFLQHLGVQVDGVRINRWQYWWLALTWSIWKLRNSIVFSNATFNANSLFEDATFLLWSWLRSFEKDFTVHFNQWASSFTQSFMYQQRIT